MDTKINQNPNPNTENLSPPPKIIIENAMLENNVYCFEMLAILK